MTPLAFLRRIDWTNVRDVALVQTGAARALPEILSRVRAEFPSASIVVVADEDAAALLAADGIAIEIARPGRRLDLLKKLRERRFDVVVVQLSDEPMGELGRLAFLLRARAMLAFNQNLDWFPVNVHRIATIAQHFGGDGRGGAALVGWALKRSLLVAFARPAATLWLAGKAGWRRLRGPRSRAAVLASRRRGGGFA